MKKSLISAAVLASAAFAAPGAWAQTDVGGLGIPGFLARRRKAKREV